MDTHPTPHIPENRYNPILDGDFVHNDDITSSEMGILNGFPVRYITVDRQAIADRNTRGIHKSIASRKAREQREQQATAELTKKLAKAAA